MPAYVSENASILSLLQMMKTVTLHTAFVVDEFGSLVGLATIADVVGAVAGDFIGQGGSPQKNEPDDLKPESDGSYIVSGRQPIDDFEDFLALNEPAARGYQTFAGLVIDRLKRLPAEGDGLICLACGSRS